MSNHRTIRGAGPLALALTTACATTTPISVDARVRKLAEQEQSLRASVVQLEDRQRALHHEIEVAQRQAERARCEAKRDELAATTANLSAQYSMRYAQHHACQADAAKGGGLAAALGCGAAAFLTGGWALALCGGALVTGYVASESCDEAPPLPEPGQVQREALAQLGLQAPPRCDSNQRTLTSPYGSTTASAASPSPAEFLGTSPAPATAPPPQARPLGLVGTGRGEPAPATAPGPAAAPQPTVDPAAEAARRRRESERARAAHQARQKAAAEERARVNAARLDAEWAREKARMKSRSRAKKK